MSAATEGLAGGDGARPGADFLAAWSGRVSASCSRKSRRQCLPTLWPLKPQQSADLVAHILKLNDFPAGSSSSSPDMAALNGSDSRRSSAILHKTRGSRFSPAPVLRLWSVDRSAGGGSGRTWTSPSCSSFPSRLRCATEVRSVVPQRPRPFIPRSDHRFDRRDRDCRIQAVRHPSCVHWRVFVLRMSNESGPLPLAISVFSPKPGRELIRPVVMVVVGADVRQPLHVWPLVQGMKVHPSGHCWPSTTAGPLKTLLPSSKLTKPPLPDKAAHATPLRSMSMPRGPKCVVCLSSGMV